MTEIWIQLRMDRDVEDGVRRCVDELLGGYCAAQKSDVGAIIST